MIITCYKNHFKSIFIFRQQPQVQLKHLQRLQQQLQPQQQHQRQGHSNGRTLIEFKMISKIIMKFKILIDKFFQDKVWDFLPR